VLVDPRISVSEGHYVAETARARVVKAHGALDVMVHVDPEDDSAVKRSIHLPPREELVRHLKEKLGHHGLPEVDRIVLHYLGGKVDAEIVLPDAFFHQADAVADLRSELERALVDDGYFRSIKLLSCAP
jgi:hypothetical protein